MTDRDDPPPVPPAESIPEASPDPEPSFDEPAGPAPDVVDPPGRNSEF